MQSYFQKVPLMIVRKRLLDQKQLAAPQTEDMKLKPSHLGGWLMIVVIIASQ